MKLASKAELRKSAKDIRAVISKEEEKLAGEKLIQFFEKMPWRPTWLFYASVQNEIATEPLFHWVKSRGGKAYFPRVDGDHLSFHLIQDFTELRKTKWMPEPPETAPLLPSSRLAYALIPGLVFSRKGDRIGFGKGYYDRWLPKHPECLKMGLAYEFQISTMDWKPESHDEPMDLVFTPGGLWASSTRIFSSFTI